MKLILHTTDEMPTRVPVKSWQVPPVRTYAQIAKILAERGQAELKPRTVGRVCTAAIDKVNRALMADPQVRASLLGPPLRLHGERWAKKA